MIGSKKQSQNVIEHSFTVFQVIVFCQLLLFCPVIIFYVYINWLIHIVFLVYHVLESLDPFLFLFEIEQRYTERMIGFENSSISNLNPHQRYIT